MSVLNGLYKGRIVAQILQGKDNLKICGQTCFWVRFAVSAAVKQWSGRANQSK